MLYNALSVKEISFEKNVHFINYSLVVIGQRTSKCFNLI